MSSEKVLAEHHRLSYKEWSHSSTVLRRLEVIQQHINLHVAGLASDHIYRNDLRILQIGSGADIRPQGTNTPPEFCRFKGARGSSVVGLDQGRNNPQLPVLYRHITLDDSIDSEISLPALLQTHQEEPLFDVVYVDTDVAIFNKPFGEIKSQVFSTAMGVLKTNGLYILKDQSMMFISQQKNISKTPSLT
jgi:hypothetical protein